MTNGLGAGFGGLMLLAVLLLLATIQIVLLLGIYVSRRRLDSVPGVLRYVSVVVLAGVILVGGFAVLVLYDEAWRLAVLFLAIVFVPLGAMAVSLYRQTELTLVDGVAAVGLAWSVPFLVGVGVILGLIIGSSELGLATTSPEQQAVAWIATAVGGAVVMIGSVLLGRQVDELLVFDLE